MFQTGAKGCGISLRDTLGCGGLVIENNWWRGSWWRLNPPAVPFASNGSAVS